MTRKDKNKPAPFTNATGQALHEFVQGRGSRRYKITAERLIEHFGLKPLEAEGGHFKRTYRAEETVKREALPGRYGSDKSFGTAIYYLLSADADSFSALHRLASDEIYHFYLGDPVEMLLLERNGKSRRVILGADVLAGQHVQFVVRQRVWQGLRLVAGGRVALLGATMALGYDDADYESGDCGELSRLYPKQAALIRSLTRR